MLMVFPSLVKADNTWLNWFNQGIFAFNNGVSDVVTTITDVLPSTPSNISDGIRNFTVTWVGEPLNIGAHLIAGRTKDAGTAGYRIITNAYRGWFGFVDRAAEEGVVTTPIDYGLALCTRGVPAGLFIVVPLTGIRTTRDFIADWVAAHIVIYSIAFGIIGIPVSVQNVAMLEIIEEL
ncbi:hypothetical protein TI03_01115, partial [Achromatium sp. WMS1]